MNIEKMDGRQKNILRICGMETEKIGRNIYRATNKDYVWHEAWKEDFEAIHGNMRFRKEKGSFVFHFVNGSVVEEAKVIRKHLRAKALKAGTYPFSVRKDGGWIKIKPMNGRAFTLLESFVLKEFGLNPGIFTELIAPSQTAKFAKKAIKAIGEDQF